jgi:hypothetical protein
VEPTNIFFDVDYTLVMGDGRLRPHAKEVFTTLTEAGHPIYIWSGVGIRRFDMRYHGLHDFVTGYFVKPTYRYRERLEELDVTVFPDFCVDDHQEVIDAFGGVCVSEFARKDDRELLDVLEKFQAFVQQRHEQHQSGGGEPQP